MTTRPDLDFVLYTRNGCHLCDVAKEQLDAAQRTCAFPLEIIDVDSSADLVAEHGDCVPVVVVNGKVRFRGRVNEVLLRRILEVR